jgi:hypothetical protein
MSETPAFGSTREALGVLRAAMRYLCAADATEMAAGATLVLNKDGTTTAWNPDRTKILHSHSPPARAG